MKKLFVIMTMVISTQAFSGEDCPYKVIEETGKVISLPIYEAKTFYLFDNKDKKASAYVKWKLDSDVTRDCFKKNQSLFPLYKVIIPRVSVSELSVRVLKGQGEERLIIYPEAGGHYNGETDLIEVDYNSKKNIIDAIRNNAQTAFMSGEFMYSYINFKPTALETIPCENGPVRGVVNLHRRLGEIIKALATRRPEERVDRELVLDQFMTNCVQFDEEEFISTTGFGRLFVKKTRLKEGVVEVRGMKEELRLEALNPVLKNETTILEY